MSVTTTVSVSFDAQKLHAIKTYMRKKDADLEAELSSQLQRLYDKFVPPAVRDYIEEEAKQEQQQLKARTAVAGRRQTE